VVVKKIVNLRKQLDTPLDLVTSTQVNHSITRRGARPKIVHAIRPA
jgi:hypothetical protein